MNMFDSISLLFAPPGGGGEGGGGSSFVTLITFGLVFLIFYFLIIRPQSKRQKETKNMLANLKKGDKVVTIGGIRGVIQSLKEDAIILKIAGDTVVEFSRSAISGVVGGAKGAPASAAKNKNKDQGKSISK